MEFYRIRTENDVRVYKKTGIPMLILMLSVVLLVWAGIATACGIHWHNEYESLFNEHSRFMEQSRLELRLAGAEREHYAEIIDRAKSSNSELGRALQQSVGTLQDVRVLVREVRARYEEMEELLNSVGNNDGSVLDSNRYPDSCNP
jgi:uncharacterized protein HemX